MLSQSTIAEAAGVAGVGEATVYRYLADETFATALHAAQDRAIDAAISRLSGEASSAANTLAVIHRDETVSAAVRVQAAQAVLRMVLQLREQKELTDRVAALEERLQ